MSRWGRGGCGAGQELCLLLPKVQGSLRCLASPTALGFGSRNCSCRLSTTYKPSTLCSPGQQPIFILIPALCCSLRVVWKVFALCAPAVESASTAQTPTCCCSCVGIAVPWACWRVGRRAGPRVPGEGARAGPELAPSGHLGCRGAAMRGSHELAPCSPVVENGGCCCRRLTNNYYSS